MMELLLNKQQAERLVVMQKMAADNHMPLKSVQMSICCNDWFLKNYENKCKRCNGKAKTLSEQRYKNFIYLYKV